MPAPADTLGINKRPPQAVEAEMAVIASVLLLPSVYDEIELSAEEFYADRHQRIWTAITELRRESPAVDVLILAEALERRQILTEIGGVEYLAKLLETVPNASHAAYYAKIVRDSYRRRELLYRSRDLIEKCYTAETDDLEDIISGMSDTMSLRHSAQSISMSDAMVETWNSIHERIASEKPAGIPTGFHDLDNLIVGVEPGELVLVAARPGDGKSVMMGCWSANLSRAGIPSLILSLEMYRTELLERILTAEAGVSGTLMRTGTGISSETSDTMSLAAGRISEWPLRIDDSPSRSVKSILAVARRHQQKYGTKVVFVDYLQLIEPESRRDVREQQVASILRGLKRVARDLGLTVVVLAQINRGPEQRDDKRPRLSDIRESGSAEADSDKVLFLHHPGKYDPTLARGEVELIVAKNRNGAVGIIKLSWSPEFRRIADLAPAWDRKYEFK